ncbi:HU family DNA-binding protein [Hydrocarboniphaga effusa]|uniref:HU family DNA-binding protein n=1 Tax=Hydrocarboniphaga effusa TaxID=243629 RepID=UPI00398BC2D9
MAAADVVSTTALIEQISAKSGLSKAQVKSVLGLFVESTAKHLKRGTKVRVSGLGTFAKSSRGARKGRNPSTGEAIKIKASKSVRFKPSTTLKGSL